MGIPWVSYVYQLIIMSLEDPQIYVFSCHISICSSEFRPPPNSGLAACHDSHRFLSSKTFPLLFL